MFSSTVADCWHREAGTQASRKPPTANDSFWPLCKSCHKAHKQASAADRFGAVEIMSLCGQTTFRSSLAAALLWVGGRARHPAGAPARWSQLGV